MTAIDESPSPSEASGPASRARAGFWRRLGGTAVDAIVLNIVAVPLELGLNIDFRGALSLVLSVAYLTLFVGASSGQSPGMRVVSIRVVSAEGGGTIGYRRALIRAVGGYISALALFLGFLWMLWDKEKQCWHDKLADDVVVPTSAYL
jgi:uncharacterized RDD family membrane protein YckC